MEAPRKSPEPLSKRARIGRAVGAAAAIAVVGIAAFPHQAEQTIHSIEHVVSGNAMNPGQLDQVQLQVNPGDTADDLLHKVGDTGLTNDERHQLDRYINDQGAAHDQYGNPVLRAGQEVQVPVEPDRH